MIDRTPPIPRACLEAWDSSYFAELPLPIRNLMLRDAMVLSVPGGDIIYEANRTAKLALLHHGQARVNVVSKDGRTATVRYAGAGQVIGLPALISQTAPVGAEAITDCELSMLNVSVIRRIAQRDVQVAWLLARQASEIVFETIEFLSTNMFEPVEQRVCRHLLDLADVSVEGMVVHVDQQELADSIGSVREVVGRALRRLRQAGLISASRETIHILDARRLHEAAVDGLLKVTTS